jgi:hypothetical protein
VDPLPRCSKINLLGLALDAEKVGNQDDVFEGDDVAEGHLCVLWRGGKPK